MAILTDFDTASCMDLLHSDVTDDESEAACEYEYARESQVLREAARLHRQGLSFEEIAEEIDQAFSCGGLFLASPWLEIFSSSAAGLFPLSPWNHLPEEARERILRAFPLPYGSGQPLFMHDVRRLERVLKGLMEKATKARAEQTAKKVLAVWHEGPWTYPLPTIDCRKAKKQLVDEFEAWLEQPEMKERLRQYRHSHTGKTGAPKDRLKDLAAWRLYQHCGNDWRKANEFASEHRRVFEKPETIVIGSGGNRKKVIFKEGDPKPFHDPRQGQSKQQINEASLYSEESGFLKAKQRAKTYLKELMPWEFFQEARAAELKELLAQAQRAYEQLPEGRGPHELAEMMRDLLQVRENDPDPLVKLKQDELKRVKAAREARFRAFDPGI